jgi:hypothetical protein
VKIEGIEIDLANPVLCPRCGEPMLLDLPHIMVGDDLDLGKLMCEAADDIERWICSRCEEFCGFPENYTQERMAEIMDKANEHLLTDGDKLIVEMEGPGGLL